MEKFYNLSMLFGEGEFDAQRGYRRYGSKEAYFSVLYRFTLDAKTLIERCRVLLCGDARMDIDAITRCSERLQGTLANIGAINLAWTIQSLNVLLEKKDFIAYSEGFAEVLLLVDNLCKRIECAEKANSAAVPAIDGSEEKNIRETDGKKMKMTKPRRTDFEKLLMLVDNFELESAERITNSIMRYSYTPEIDDALIRIKRALKEFDHTLSLDEAKRLIGLVTNEIGAESLERKNILAIDDIPSVLVTIEAMLKKKYNVYCMTDYDSAIKFLRSNTADLILLDIEMPGIDGFAMMQLFRCLPEYADTPIVFLTGNVSNDHIKMAINLGARDFIRKPVDLAVLLSKLEGALADSTKPNRPDILKLIPDKDNNS